jgi:hypothetical protein
MPLHRARNLVKRFFNKIRQCRRTATRDKLADNYLAFIKTGSQSHLDTRSGVDALVYQTVYQSRRIGENQSKHPAWAATLVILADSA